MGRVGGASCAAEKRRRGAGGRKPASTSDWLRLSERSARKARSEFRSPGPTASITGNPAIGGASTRPPNPLHPNLGQLANQAALHTPLCLLTQPQTCHAHHLHTH